MDNNGHDKWKIPFGVSVPTMNERENLLSGLRVIDCGTYIAGPAAATMLSDFGAEVIKIERTQGGDPYRYLSFLPGMPVSEHNYCWLLDARNKKSLAIDLREEAGREVLRKLIGTADIFHYKLHSATRRQVSGALRRYRAAQPAADLCSDHRLR
jgi:crotonobetainyl-CoA:carnitine CoA-transferase CaiB-like acyl-CoA transferase